MNVTSWLWTGFSIPEWGKGREPLSEVEIEMVQEYLRKMSVPSEWIRRPGDWLTWEIPRGVDETLRRVLQEGITKILSLVQGREVCLRWTGIRTTMVTVVAMNEHLQ